MTRIADVLAAAAAEERPCFSFELFPPKNDEAERALDKAVAELAELEPDFVSVTYGALGSTRDRTRDLVIRIDGEQRFPAMAHLTCVGHTRADIGALLDAYAEAGVANILALGGDPPADGSDPGGDFTHAIELVELVRAHPGGFSVGVAAHPELHPRSPDRVSDRRHLADKLAVADFAITQFFFSVRHYARMLDELAELGCTSPVIPGVMPFVSVSGLRRMAGMNGTHIPSRLDARLRRLEGDPQSVVDLGVEVAVDLCRDLLELGAPGLHLYALNRSESVRRVHAAVGL